MPDVAIVTDTVSDLPHKWLNSLGLRWLRLLSALNEANNLVQKLRSTYPQVPIYLSRASPVIGTHTGPGLIVVSVLGDKPSAA